MRTLIALASCILFAGCSSGDPSQQTAPTPRDTPASSPSPSGASVDPCALLSDEEVVELAGGAVGAGKPGMTGGLPNCQWATDDGRFVQTIGSTASDWVRALPAALRAFEASGQFRGESLTKLRDGAALVEAGQDIDPGQACSLFSEMVELQGKPAGTSSWIVTVFPTRENPQAVTGQMCTGGRFTSVMVGAEAGLQEPLPVEQVGQALKSASRKRLG